MRDAVGSTWIFSLVISFTLIFAGFLVLSLSYSKAYKLKNEITSMIEKYEGITNTDASANHRGSLMIINQYLQNSSYSTTGRCPVGSYASNDLTANTLVAVTANNSNQDYYYCISKSTVNQGKCSTIFEVTIFYNFNLPILGQLSEYSITGQTNEVIGAYFLSNTPLSC